MSALVSILIPCYNAAPWLAEALDSALNQTYRPIEIIVINDGSTDNSRDVLRRYESRGVLVVDQPNQGQSAAANHAFKLSKGDFVKFFDADDVIAPDMIELQVQRLGSASQDIASCEWGRFYHDDIRTFRLNEQSVWRDMRSTDWLVEAWRDARQMMQCALWLIPRPVLTRSGLWNERLSLINDFEFFTRVLCAAESVRFTSKARLHYRSGNASTLSKTKDRKAADSAFASVSLATQQLLKHRDDQDAKQSCANVFQDFIYTFYPAYPDLCDKAAQQVDLLGGSNLPPDGSPNARRLQRLIGWRYARRIEHIVRTVRLRAVND